MIRSSTSLAGLRWTEFALSMYSTSPGTAFESSPKHDASEPSGLELANRRKNAAVSGFCSFSSLFVRPPRPRCSSAAVSSRSSCLRSHNNASSSRVHGRCVRAGKGLYSHARLLVVAVLHERKRETKEKRFAFISNYSQEVQSICVWATFCLCD